VRSSGFNVLVSDAFGAEFERQLEDAERFLADHAPEFERLAATGGADEPWLDFGIERARLPSLSFGATPPPADLPISFHQ